MRLAHAAACFLLFAAFGIASQTQLALPFQSSFNSLYGWSVDAATGNSVKLAGGALVIHARRNTFAHVTRALNRDLVTATADIRPAPADSWATSVFLYWAPGDWIQLGIKPLDGGCYYMTQCSEGFPTEMNLGRCKFDAWHRVRIELARDCIRLYSSKDGKKWRTEHVLERPFSLEGPAKLLVVGKGYGTGAAPYAQPNLNNSYAEAGEMGTSLVRSVSVAKTPAGRVRASSAERMAWDDANRDAIGAEIMALPGDPTYEELAKRFPAMKHPRAIVGVKDHPHDVGIARDGTILLKDDQNDAKQPIAYFEIDGKPLRGEDCVQHYPYPGVPSHGSSWTRGDLRFDQGVSAFSDRMSPDAPLIADIALTVWNSGKTAREVTVGFRVVPENEHCRPRTWHLTVPPTNRLVMSLIGSPPKTARIRLRVPFDVLQAGYEEIPADDRASSVLDVYSSWQSVSGNTMLRGPKREADAYRDWLMYNFLNVDKKNGVYEPHDGTQFYEEVYGYSAALYCNALDLWGFHEDSQRYLDSLLTFQQPDGLFTVNFGLPDTGALLFAISQHAAFTHDKAWLRKVAPNMVRMCDWVIRKHHESLESNAPAVVRGLILFRPYCDHPFPTYSYLSDAFCCAGMEQTARALRSIGQTADADRIAREAASYRKNILASMDKAIFAKGGVKMLPLEPLTHRLLKRTQYHAGEYYGLVAGMLLEAGFFAPDDPRAKVLTDFLETRGGLAAGMIEFAGGIDHAYTYGYWLNCLERDKVERVLLGFYGSMACGMSRDTFAGVEVTRHLTGENDPTTPHTYSGTEQLRLLRMMLLREEGDTLWIGQAMPRQWLKGAQTVKLTKAPTLFGDVSVEYSSRPSGNRLDADLTFGSHFSAKKIKLRFRQPAGKKIRSVTLNGKPISSDDGETVVFAPVGRTMEIVARY